MATQAELAGSDVVYGRALQILKRSGTPDDVRRSVVVRPSADLASLTIRATSGDPAEAANLANAVGTAYEQVAGERMAADAKAAITRLQQVMAQREAEFDSLRAQIAQSSGPDQAILERKALHVADLIGELQVHQHDIAAQAAVYGSGVESFQQAVPPVSSSQPAPLLLALFGAVLGLVAAGGWAWWAAGRNRRVEAEGDAGAILGVPLLGETPRLGAKLRWTGGRIVAAGGVGSGRRGGLPLRTGLVGACPLQGGRQGRRRGQRGARRREDRDRPQPRARGQAGRTQGASGRRRRAHATAVAAVSRRRALRRDRRES